MKLITGLGNPGNEYAGSKHNVGFMTLDLLQTSLEADPFKKEKKFNAEISFAEVADEKIVLCKPQTYMNLSGEAVLAVSHFYKISPRDILVIYDDLDVALGKIRIRKSGGAGTHNGMKSVVAAIGEGFPRIRVGIETREALQISRQDAASYVLSPFQKADTSLLKSALDSASQAALLILEGKIDQAMNKFN